MGKNASNSSSSSNAETIPSPVTLNGLGTCISSQSSCTQVIYYSPRNSIIDTIMNAFAVKNKLMLNTDVVGFRSTNDIKLYLANNLGIFFVNNKLWSRVGWPNTLSSSYPSKPLNYVIFSNSSVKQVSRAALSGVNDAAYSADDLGGKHSIR